MAGKHTKATAHMDAERLRLLLQKSYETGAREFKREWYKIDASNPGPTVKRQKGELTKDILSLANGNAIVAGEEAYLIIGASNQINAEGTRDLFDVAQTGIDTHRILGIVNASCDPPLEEINCDTVILDGKRLVVITIPPTPHLYETTQKLETQDHPYDAYTVFIRHGEDIQTASAREREAILKMKQITFNEMRNPPAMQFGAIVGACAGAVIASSLSGEKLVSNKRYWPISGLTGIGLGGLIGWFVGYVHSSRYEIRLKWPRTSTTRRAMGIGAASVAAAGTWLLIFKPIKNALKKQAAKGIGLGTIIKTWIGL
jgi:hypothetical protein